jgi:hypothetical protein
VPGAFAPQFPTPKLEIAFGQTGPHDTNPPWTDVTKHFRGGSGDAGRSFELDRMETGTATFRLESRDGTFDPTNEQSTLAPGWNQFYANKVVPLLQIRFSMEYAGSVEYWFTGFIEDYDIIRKSPRDLELTLHCVDGMALMQMAEVGLYYAPQHVDDRIRAALEDGAWPAARTIINTGNVNVQGQDYGDQSGNTASILEVIGDAVDAELGTFYCDRRGNAVFRGRGWRIDCPKVKAIFGDDPDILLNPDHLPMRDLTLGWSQQEMRNVVTVSAARPPDVPSTVIAYRGQTTSDSVNVRRYGKRHWKSTDLLIDRTIVGSKTYTANEIAQWYSRFLLWVYKRPSLRASSLVIRPITDVRLWGTVNRLELGDLVELRTEHPGGGGLSPRGKQGNLFYIEHRSWTVDAPYSCEVVYEVSPAARWLDFPDSPDARRLNLHNPTCHYFPPTPIDGPAPPADAKKASHLTAWWPLGDIVNGWPRGVGKFADASIDPNTLAPRHRDLAAGSTNPTRFTSKAFKPEFSVLSIADSDGGGVDLNEMGTLDYFGGFEGGGNYITSQGSGIDLRTMDEFAIGLYYWPPFPQALDTHPPQDLSDLCIFKDGPSDTIRVGDRNSGGDNTFLMWQGKTNRGILSNVDWNVATGNRGFAIEARPLQDDGDVVWAHSRCDVGDSFVGACGEHSIFDPILGIWYDPCDDWRAYTWTTAAGTQAPWVIDFCTYAGGRTVHRSVVVQSLELETGQKFDFVCGVTAKRGETLKFFYGHGVPSGEIDTGILTENLVPGPTDTKGYFHLGNVNTISAFDTSARFGWGIFDEAFMFDKAYGAAAVAQQLTNLLPPAPPNGPEVPPPPTTPTEPPPDSGGFGGTPAIPPGTGSGGDSSAPGPGNVGTGGTPAPTPVPAGVWTRVQLSTSLWENGVTFDPATDEVIIGRRGIYNTIVWPGWSYNLGPGATYYQLLQIVVHRPDGTRDVLATIDSRYDSPVYEGNLAFEVGDRVYAEVWHNSPYTLTLSPQGPANDSGYFLVRFAQTLAAS